MTRMMTTRGRTHLCGWLWMALLAPTALAGTFGRVVPIGGHASDLALDEGRGVLYVANFTANRIEVMSIADGSIQTSMNVAAQPSSLALSPDARHLVVGHFGNFTAPNSPANSLTVIDLNTRGRQTFVLGSPVLGVGFGIDGRALVVTSTDFQLLDPVSGATQLLQTISGLTATSLPAPAASFPPNIVAASVGVSGDGRTIFGLTDVFTFRYAVELRQLRVIGFTSTPTMGPRAVGVNRDGTRFVGGWVLEDREGSVLAQFPSPNGSLNFGGHIYDSDRDTIYSEVPTSGGGEPGRQAPVLQVLDASNLRVRERLQLPEHLGGKGALRSDGMVAYAISDSGVLILPVGGLDREHRVVATQEDVIFRGNFCDRRVATQEIGIVNPGGGSTGFALSTTTPGIRISPSSGVTPATVRISVDPNAFQNLKGTLQATITISSSAAVNLPASIRVLINNREPDQRGTVVNVPGKLVDVLADPTRDRFFLLRQDTNEVLVFDGVTYNLTARLPTGNTPTQMAITFDRRHLLIGSDNSQIIVVYDLETLEPQPFIRMPGGHYPRSIAASGKAILAANRVAGPVHTIDRVDMTTRTATQLPTLGVYNNDVSIDTVLIASANGGSIMAAQSTGNVLLYNANVDSFTISRKDVDRFGGAYAASSFDQFVVGDRLLNSSLVTVRTLESGTGRSSGFVFIDEFALRTTAPDATSPGVIQRLDLQAASATTRATRMAEAPLLGSESFAFTRTLAPLFSRNVIINLTASGFTVLPWNYDAAVPPPQISRVVNAADGSPGLSPGGLISITGSNLSPVNLASRELPLPTALGESCLTVNGIPTPILFVSPSQINAQMPFNVEGNVTMILRTPGGISDNFNLQVRPGAPGVFRSSVGTLADVPTLIRDRNGEFVTLSNPIHRGDTIVIFLTGLGRTNPVIDAGTPAPGDPPLTTLVEPRVTLAGIDLPIIFAGLSPGQVGVYQINAEVPGFVPLGVQQPLVIFQSGGSTELAVRVVQ